MFKLFSALLLAVSFQAQANDSAIAIVEVLGVNPGANVSEVTTSFYGGQAKRFADVMPVSDVVGGRSATFVSDLWVASFWCSKQYERPTNGQWRDDWMCTINLSTRNKSGVDGTDGDKFYPNIGDFSTFNSGSNNPVLGIVPAKKSGHLFSFYGKNAGFFASRMPESVFFQSPRYDITITCNQHYERPTTGEWRNDYMCSVYAQPL